MGRPPSTGGPAFRFNGAEVMEMEAILKDHNNNMPALEVLGAIADKFSNSPERKGKFVVQTKQIWNWFQNKRYAIRAKGYKTPTKLTVTSVQLMSSGVPMQSVPVVSTTPVVKVTTAVPVASSATVISGEDNLASSRLSQPVVDPPGLVSSDNTPMEFEARSARDGAWYDVASFLSLRNMEAGCPEVLVRFAGFGPEEDEWINVTTHVRHRSLPCESSECVAVLPGDLILCFQEGKEQALYFDAHVLDTQRRRHDARGCRCRFLVRYDHDQSEEIVPLRKICRRPETDYRLQQLHAMTEVSAEQRKSAPSTGVLSKEQHKPVPSLEQIKTDVDSPISKSGISTSETTSVQKSLAPLDPSSASEEQKGAMDYSNAAPTNTQLPHPEVINLDPEIEVENNPHEVKSPTDDMAVDQPPEKHTYIMPTDGIDATSTHNMTEEVRNDASLSAVTENVCKPERVNPEPLMVKTNITTDEGNANIDHSKRDPVETNITTDDGKAYVDHCKFDPASSSSTPADAGFSYVEGSGPKLTSSIGKISLEKEVPEGKTDVDSGSATLTSTIDAVDHPVEVSNPSNSMTPNDDVENFTDDDAPTEYGIK